MAITREGSEPKGERVGNWGGGRGARVRVCGSAQRSASDWTSAARQQYARSQAQHDDRANGNAERR